MARGRITIDEERCKGCALCTIACPHDLIMMADDQLNAHGYHPAILVDADGRCTGCALCAVICPDVSITVFREQSRTIPLGT